MAAEMKLLLIAGMGESVALARDLAALPGVGVTCVQQGRAVARAAPPVKTYEGQFETPADFASDSGPLKARSVTLRRVDHDDREAA